MPYNVPHNFTRPDGTQVSGYDNPANVRMWSEDGFKDEPVPTPPPLEDAPFALSKIKIGDAFEALGLLDQFEAFRDSDKTRARRWRDAVVLMSDDPDVAMAVAYFAQELKWSDEQVRQLLESCRSDL